jgi:thiol-disulfide isomerase/thioredoxin
MRRFLFVVCFLCTHGVLSSQSIDSQLPKIEKITHSGLMERVRQDSGSVVLINVWATWCKPCREEMPNLIKLQKELKQKDFTLILVSADDIDIVDSIVRPALKSFGVRFPSFILNENDDEFITAMNPEWKGAFALPTSFLYNKQGKLAEMLVGGKTYKKFSAAVKKLMK